jgi:hypothetical protein
VAAPTKTAAVIASGMLALGAGLGIATTAYADTTATPIPAPTSAPSDVPAPQTEPPGVPSNPGDPKGEDALVEELSRMLGVDQETIRAGLEELRATYGPQVKAALKTQLDEAVRNGTLTQAEADALQKMIEEGVHNFLR